MHRICEFYIFRIRVHNRKPQSATPTYKASEHGSREECGGNASHAPGSLSRKPGADSVHSQLPGCITSVGMLSTLQRALDQSSIGSFEVARPCLHISGRKGEVGGAQNTGYRLPVAGISRSVALLSVFGVIGKCFLAKCAVLVFGSSATDTKYNVFLAPRPRSTGCA